MESLHMVVIIKVLSGVLACYLTYTGFLFTFQRKLLFPAGLIAVPNPPLVIHNREIIWLDVAGGKVEAWFLPPLSKAAVPSPVIIFAHGNGEIIDFWPEELLPLCQLGFGILLVEYPGYGRSSGSPSEQSIRQTFLTAYDLICQRENVDSNRIILMGRSLGGGAVCSILNQRKVAAVILMSTFTSARTFAKQYLAPQFLVRDAFDNLSQIRSYQGPVLIIHGKSDTVIPFAHGATLAQAAQNAKLIPYNSGHNDCPPDWPSFYQDLEAFWSQNRLLPNQNQPEKKD